MNEQKSDPFVTELGTLKQCVLMFSYLQICKRPYANLYIFGSTNHKKNILVLVLILCKRYN